MRLHPIYFRPAVVAQAVQERIAELRLLLASGALADDHAELRDELATNEELLPVFARQPDKIRFDAAIQIEGDYEEGDEPLVPFETNKGLVS